MSNTHYTVVVEAGPLKGRRYPVTATGLKLGRSSQCDIAISDPLLSRSHCRFELRGEELWVADLASANETLVNDVPVTEQQLRPTDTVKVGQTILRAEQSDVSDTKLPDAAASSSAVPPISPIMIIPVVSGSALKSLITSRCEVPLTGSPPMPTQVDWPTPREVSCHTASYVKVPLRDTTPILPRL